MTKEELLEKIDGTEWSDFEIKEAKDQLPKNIWETVSAFSNTSGGWIVLGVKEIKRKGFSIYEIQGVENPEKIEQDFINPLRSEKFNTVIAPKVEKFEIEGKIVLAFYIPESPFKPVFYNTPKNTFIRSGSGDQHVNDYEFGSLHREQEFGRRSEKAVPGTSIEDLYPNSLAGYRTTLRYDNAPHSYPNLSDEDFCKKIGILAPSGEVTVGGLFMFGKRDSINKLTYNFWIDYIEIPGTSIHTAERRYTFRLQEQENIWESYNIIIQRLRNYVDNPYSPRPDGFAPDDETRLYCLREALVNLCAHSDYFDAAHPTIRVYSNHISFQNPGAFHFDVEKVKSQPIVSKPRNPNILKFFRLAKLSENAGYGIEKILNWSELTGKEVEFKTYQSISEVVFYLPINTGGNTGGNVGGNVGGNTGGNKRKDNERRIIDYLSNNATTSIKDMSQSLDIPYRTTERIVAELKKKGIIERKGDTRKSYWKVNN